MTRVTAPILRCDGYYSISPKRRKLPCHRFVEESQAALGAGWQVMQFGNMPLDMCPNCWETVQASRQEAAEARGARLHCDHSRRANAALGIHGSGIHECCLPSEHSTALHKCECGEMWP